MSHYSEVGGTAVFKTEEGAELFRAELLKGGWVKAVEDKLFYVDDGGTEMGDDAYTPATGKIVYLNGGMMCNISSLTDDISSFKDIDLDHTHLRDFSLDDEISAYEFIDREWKEIDEETLTAILGISQKEYFALEPDRKNRMDADEKGYDWVMDLECYPQ